MLFILSSRDCLTRVNDASFPSCDKMMTDLVAQISKNMTYQSPLGQFPATGCSIDDRAARCPRSVTDCEADTGGDAGIAETFDFTVLKTMREGVFVRRIRPGEEPELDRF